MRLDVALVARGLARSRNQAARLIADGQVRVDGTVASKPSQPVTEASQLTATLEPWVSRAAHKLLGALEESDTAVPARVLDAGASTGGFTQVCLSRGAERVYAFDVGHDQLAAELRLDPRVVRRDGINLRDLTLADLDEKPVDLVVADVSFISLTILLPPLLSVLDPGGKALLLVKPQFEVGRDRLGSGGVVRDDADRRRAVDTVVEAAARLGWRCDWRGTSVLPGADGNVEFFVRLVF
ncbi:TlyA family RNA methyltransferase [Tessaracoccus sp. OS52]|uniref:TlyA family RNA methyltransferase n=1 Tax=Tessaracoccus sp. OS52 TaxID=2886691 RepID=UPI001D12A65D|nr:TlyA family RNA methyltransferase [Tessaracoccus sp. OS52]MCC2593182.1 TlyA family RNA methyltransferase [Tessaracoccus sp. OS52]